MARGRRRLEKRPNQLDTYQQTIATRVHRPTCIPLQKLRGLNRSNLKFIPTPEDGLPFSLLDAAECPDTCRKLLECNNERWEEVQQRLIEVQYNSGLRMVEMVVNHSERLRKSLSRRANIKS